MAEFGQFLGLDPKGGEFGSRLKDAVGKAAEKILIAARANDEGYSEHIVGVAIFLMRKMNRSHPDLDKAARTLNCEKPPAEQRLFWDPDKDCKPKWPEVVSRGWWNERPLLPCGGAV
jgi:hypothetical protein